MEICKDASIIIEIVSYSPAGKDIDYYIQPDPEEYEANFYLVVDDHLIELDDYISEKLNRIFEDEILKECRRAYAEP